MRCCRCWEIGWWGLTVLENSCRFKNVRSAVAKAAVSGIGVSERRWIDDAWKACLWDAVEKFASPELRGVIFAVISVPPALCCNLVWSTPAAGCNGFITSPVLLSLCESGCWWQSGLALGPMWSICCEVLAAAATVTELFVVVSPDSAASSTGCKDLRKQHKLQNPTCHFTQCTKFKQSTISRMTSDASGTTLINNTFFYMATIT